MRRGRKRRASEQGLFHQDNGSTHDVAESSSGCGLVSALKRAKIEIYSTAISTSQTTDITESNSCTVNTSDPAKTHTADCDDLSSSHILSITDIEEVSSPHNNKHQEIARGQGVRPVGDSLSSRKRPREQFEELFDAATLTRAKRRRKSHTGRRWRQVKGGSRGRRWRRWRKEENWKRRARRKKNQCRKKEGMSVAQIYYLLLVYNHGN